MNLSYSFIVVAVVAVSTLTTRVIPFLLFGSKRHEVPTAVLYLGKVLPPAVMATLVVYSLKGLSFSEPSLWANHLIAVVVTAGAHVLKRNTLLSIGLGTAVHMVLVQGAFL